MAPPLVSSVVFLTATIAFQFLVTVKGQVVGSACTKTAQCSSTCGKIIYCENEKIPETVSDCPVSHPYCVNDVRADRCSNVPDPSKPECSPAQRDFYCTDIGYFPDPTNCQNYFICSYDAQQNIIPKAYSCPPQHIFNYGRNKECTRYTNPPASICPVINCSSETYSYAIPYPRDPSYFYFCVPQGATYTPIIFRCPDGWTHNGRKCIYNCTREGRFSFAGSDTKYYECNIINGRYVYSIETCPSGFKFVQNIGICQLQ